MLPLTLTTLALLLSLTPAQAEKKAIRPPSGPSSGPYSAGILAGDFLYVSGHVGPEPTGGFAPGDVKTQTRRSLDLVGKVLREAGLDFSHVVSATLYLTDIRTLDAADAAWREVFPGPVYPARIDIESPLLIPEALSEVSVIAVRAPNPAQAIRVINPTGWTAPKRPISHAILAANTLFFSTLRPVDPTTGTLAGTTLADQTAQIVRNQQALLQTAGLAPNDLAAVRIFTSDPRLPIRYPGPPSLARSTAVAGPLELGHLLHVQAVAHAPNRNAPVYVPGMAGQGATIADQTRDALQRLDAAFRRRGCSLADSIEAVVWLRDPRDAAAMNAVYRDIVKPNPAARATVRLSPIDLDSRITINMTAHCTPPR
ncbi:MAG: hypothetical protein JNK87_39870 [Bryobacterales bacterium]|nr:hypothetical protein [Bryobacterales bacterium]